MVWGLFPVDPVSGENKYYIFTKGSYKIGRKGCDIVINKDKGVSRVHAEIFVDAMTSSDPLDIKSSILITEVRVRDCSKYGTFVNKNLGSMEKVHQLPNKEIALKDWDLISFGTGNATYRFCYVPLNIWICSTGPFLLNKSFEGKLSAIGAHFTHNYRGGCTHVLVDQLMPVKDHLLDAIVAKKPFVMNSWIETLTEQKIRTEIPSCGLYSPTMAVAGISTKIADPEVRQNCLKGYTFLLDSVHKYKFRDHIKCLLEVSGAKIDTIEGFSSSSHGSDYEGNTVCVVPGGSADNFDSFNKLKSIYRVKEIDLICAVLSGQLDPSILMSSCVVVSSSCSTDETIVADSEAEEETAACFPATSIRCREKITESLVKMKDLTDHATTNHSLEKETATLVIANSIGYGEEVTESLGKMDAWTSCAALDHSSSFRSSGGGIPDQKDRVGESECGNSDIIYSQNILVRDPSRPAVSSSSNYEVLNFKCFRKKDAQSGNSFNNLIPFSKSPYEESYCKSEEMVESMREEKRRKGTEAIAEDLFNNEKGKKRGTTGYLSGLLAHG